MRNNTSRFVYRALFAASILMLITGWYLGYSNAIKYIAKDSVTIVKVETGDFSMKIEGYGTLQSLNKRLLTATSNAVVDEIKLKAGAAVNANTVIMTLKNSKLEGDLRQALAKLQNSKTQKRQAVLQQQREMLNNESSLSELESEAEISMLQVEAERTLAKSGIVSGISAKRNELRAKQLIKRVKLEKNKLVKLTAVHKEALSIQDDLIAQSQEEFDVAKYTFEQLSVKAGMKGIIQRASLNLGQSVATGTELALIGSLSPLVAEIKVPQLQAHMVIAGMSAEINTVNGQIKGRVIRVDPVVIEGAVQVDIQLVNSINEGVKPMQLVDAIIIADVKKGVHYIKTPTGVNENSSAFLFKLIDDNQASRVKVQFGKISGQLIQVLYGLQTGDQVITSKLEIEEDTKHIMLGS
ncbi:efflux RND transporter periplasmic adaptor subunit [Pseudoalteromonas denitrificans]|uniref:Multidrug efflux pump subunit AcrA (Membrane-fusion protein) n=1 Tax=Pseudoalteromonas denitrificans DSM 6059 TaxID=1123010 RepID=A0A1I1JPN9_9GAMM|nr:HlyD family efflux transporter periplasmic adaptor subunit [Pseudoalteromonas denitrificans]SFC48508.1 Multidrug efflux pump subunit AcrA (membrane-fusion protein) [Pseudoalteromonas denitrificans DSM 6059]